MALSPFSATWRNDVAKLLNDAAGFIATAVHAATGKTTPVDNDELALIDSAASNVLKKLTWANLRAELITTGTWTPTVSANTTDFDSVSYVTQTGAWVALNLGSGKFLVWLAFTLVFTPTIGSGAGAFNIEGFSGTWTADSAAQNAYAGSISDIDSGFVYTGTRTQAGIFMNASANKIRLNLFGSNLSSDTVDAANMTTGAAHLIAGHVIFRASQS